MLVVFVSTLSSFFMLLVLICGVILARMIMKKKGRLTYQPLWLLSCSGVEKSRYEYFVHFLHFIAFFCQQFIFLKQQHLLFNIFIPYHIHEMWSAAFDVVG